MSTDQRNTQRSEASVGTPPSPATGEKAPTAGAGTSVPELLGAYGIHLPALPKKPKLRGMIHLVAFPAALIAGMLLIATGSSLAVRLATVVFIVTAGMLFGVSATYHRGTWSVHGTLVLRRFDHANIFLIIAGTYTPLAVALLNTHDATVLLTVCWVGALIGVAFRLLWTSAPRWLYVPAYVALGWVAIFYMPELYAGGGAAVIALIIAGGIAYTLGAVVYGTKKPDPSPAWFGFHEIFHSFTVVGFVCHLIAVWLSVV
ncbi:PAQR family membrane homeostasis protein TrhA [Dermabacter vaginalis]|nr:hemolysin III family protein [Dermabacter vaginalis]